MIVFLIEVKFIIIFLIIFVVSCSDVRNSVCRVNGSDDYFRTDLLRSLNVPDNLSLPLVSNEYDIPSVIDSDLLKIGKELDICPPILEY